MKPLEELHNIVLGYPKLIERLEKRPYEKERVLEIIEECRGDFSYKLVGSLQKMLEKTFFKLYDDLSLTHPEDMDVKKVAEENNVIFVPNHQSHADYIFLTALFFSKFKIPIYVAGGNNLNIFPIGRMFRKSGCFFIRRSFGSDILYKIVLEAYIYYLLVKGYPIEFFFEGGRSRTGKLRSPRYGMFQMIMEAHQHIDEKIKRPLMFIPVSVAHEILPEEKALASELGGGAKSKEKPSQLLKLYKLFYKKFGTIHVRLAKPIAPPLEEDARKRNQLIAFDCYRSVGRNMTVTPTSLLAMSLLDESSGALTWDEIYSKALHILEYCRNYNIPLSESLNENVQQEKLRRALNILIGNNTVGMIQKLDKTFYVINEGNRVQVLYFKNTILHHFLVPFFINAIWINIFNGKITTVAEFKAFLYSERDRLKYEFYLPTMRQVFRLAITIVSDGAGRKVTSVQECLELSREELYGLAKKVGVFARSCAYIWEGYYVAAMTMRQVGKEQFTLARFHELSKEVFEMELSHGRLIKFPESFSTELMGNALKLAVNSGIVEKEGPNYWLPSSDKLERWIEELCADLTSLVTFKIMANPADEFQSHD